MREEGGLFRTLGTWEIAASAAALVSQCWELLGKQLLSDVPGGGGGHVCPTADTSHSHTEKTGTNLFLFYFVSFNLDDDASA